MYPNALIRFAVAICMLAGLIVGPATFAPSHVTVAHGTVAQGTEMSSVGMEMPDGMDCCPKGQSDPNCAKCPLMALCSSPFAEHTVDLRLPERLVRTTRPAVPVDEAALAGRRAQPLPEPPRSSV